MMRRTRMAPVDTAWLRMDSPVNLMMIVGVDVCDGPVDIARLQNLVRAHLLCHLPFRSRVVVDPAGAWWEEAGDIDLDAHLVRIALPGRADKQELERLVAQLDGQALDATKPLWQFHIVERYEGGHALIIRIHHCIADGIALIGVLLGMTTTSADADDPPSPRRNGTGRGTGPLTAMLEGFTASTVAALDAAGELAGRALHGIGQAVDEPSTVRSAAITAVKTATRVTQDLAALAFMKDDTPTLLKGKPGGTKCVAWNEPLPLDDVKAVGKAIGCSVNDVLLACVAGALRAYLLEVGSTALDGAELRAMVPVNLRQPKPGAAPTLGNKFGLVPLLLPIGIADPVRRVLEVRRRMIELRDGYTPILAMTILGATGLAPRIVQQQVLDMLARKGTAVMTNVPGPQKTIYMAGARVRQMMFWVPQSGDIGAGVSILSYAGGVQFGLVTDKKLCPHPQRIIDRFAPEFENLVHAVLLMPWQEGVDPDAAARSLEATEALAGAAAHLARRDDVGEATTQPAADQPSRGSPNGGHERASAAPPAIPDRAPPPLRRKSAFARARAGARE